MILLNKFIEPTFATGKILETYFIHFNSGTPYLYAVNVHKLYLSPQEAQNDTFAYPSYNNFDHPLVEGQTYSYFNKKICDFTRTILKNNKQISLGSNTCLACFSRRIYLSFGETEYTHVYKCISYCHACVYITSKEKNLCNIVDVIENYTRYLISDQIDKI